MYAVAILLNFRSSGAWRVAPAGRNSFLRGTNSHQADGVGIPAVLATLPPKPLLLSQAARASVPQASERQDYCLQRCLQVLTNVFKDEEIVQEWLPAEPTSGQLDFAEEEFGGEEDEEEEEEEDGRLTLLRAAFAAAGSQMSAARGKSATPLESSWQELCNTLPDQPYFDEGAADAEDDYFDSEQHFIDTTGLDDYAFMAEDKTRTSWFREAIYRRLSGTKDKVVLDVGTGPFCLLALFAARAGAKRVYALEVNSWAAKLARIVLAEAEAVGFVPTGVIQVIEGLSTEVTLPEPADLLVAEIVGEIATAEGLVSTMSDAQARHLKMPYDPDSYIPQRVQTWCAPASYTVASLLRAPYSGYDFRSDLDDGPMHVACSDEGVQNLCEPQLLEDLEMYKPLPQLCFRHTKNLSFVVDAACIGKAKDAYSDIFADTLLEQGCTEAEIAHLSQELASSLACLACWPRIVLEESAESHAEPLVMESRGGVPYSAVESKGADKTSTVDSDHEQSKGSEDLQDKSHWDMVVPLLSPKPLSVKEGDAVHLTYAVEYGSRIDAPSQYDFQGELIPRFEE